MDAIERIRVEIWPDRPLVRVFDRVGDGHRIVGASAEWPDALRSAPSEAGVSAPSRTPAFVVEDILGVVGLARLGLALALQRILSAS